MRMWTWQKVTLFVVVATVLGLSDAAQAQVQGYPAGGSQCTATSCTSKTVTATATLDVKSTAVVTNSTTGKPVKVSDADGLAVACVTSLPTCDAAHKAALLMVCSSAAYQYCDGSAWQEFVPASRKVTVLGGGSFTANSEVPVAARTATYDGSVRGLAFVHLVSGVDDGTIPLRVINNATGAVLCSLTVPCNGGEGTITTTSSCTGAYAAGVLLVVEWGPSVTCQIPPNGGFTATLRE